MYAQSPVKYIENANKTYPQWSMKITEAIMNKFKCFHEILRNNGYRISCANVAEKENKYFWILLSADGNNFELEQFGYTT